MHPKSNVDKLCVCFFEEGKKIEIIFLRFCHFQRICGSHVQPTDLKSSLVWQARKLARKIYAIQGFSHFGTFVIGASECYPQKFSQTSKLTSYFQEKRIQNWKVQWKKSLVGYFSKLSLGLPRCVFYVRDINQSTETYLI